MKHPVNFQRKKIENNPISLPNFTFEKALWDEGFKSICGIDEAGRGPIAGPVSAAAVIINLVNIPTGINDSKKLSSKKRAKLYAEIKKTAYWGLGWADEREIERLNIRKATLLAMHRALKALPIQPDYALIDGRDIPDNLGCGAIPIIKGDARSLSIGAASIIAKHARDMFMYEKSFKYPLYGWEKNAGYPTKAHINAVERYGVTQHHRKSFAPIYNILNKKNISSFTSKKN